MTKRKKAKIVTLPGNRWSVTFLLPNGETMTQTWRAETQQDAMTKFRKSDAGHLPLINIKFSHTVV